MKRLIFACGVLVASALLIPGDAEARRGGGGGGFRGGGGGGHRMAVHRGGSHQMGGGQFRGGAIAARPGTGGFRHAAIGDPGGRFDNGIGNRGAYYGNRNDRRYGVRQPGSYAGRYYGGRYPNYGGYYGRYGGYYGNSPYYGWGAAGLATGAVIGAAATYPYYNAPYSTYQTTAVSADGGYCATTVRTCALISSAPIGTGCSCRTQGGRARGTVIGQ
jgi:hypothetical protein